MKKMTSFEKENIMKAFGLLKDFIHEFEGGENDENNFGKLCYDLSKLKIGISNKNFEKIDCFIRTELEAMIYDFESVFVKKCSIGHVEDGVRNNDTEKKSIEICSCFFEVLFAKEEILDKFMMDEFHEQLIN